MIDLKGIIAKNIIQLRKSMNWTQTELAQRLNYSDKAISKWERAESVPDIVVLKEMVDLFNVSMDYLVEAEHPKSGDDLRIVSQQKRLNRMIIALVSVTLVFFIATIMFVILNFGLFELGQPTWMVYIYALPFAFIVLLVFNSIWGKRRINFVIITLFLWCVLLAVYLSFHINNIWLIFIIGIPLQIIILLLAKFKFKSIN